MKGLKDDIKKSWKLFGVDREDLTYKEINFNRDEIYDVYNLYTQSKLSLYQVTPKITPSKDFPLFYQPTQCSFQIN